MAIPFEELALGLPLLGLISSGFVWSVIAAKERKERSAGGAIALGENSPVSYSHLYDEDAFNATDAQQEDTLVQPKAKAILYRTWVLFLLGLVPTVLSIVGLVFALEPSSDRTTFHRLAGPIVLVTAWSLTTALLFLILLHQVPYKYGLQPLQWFYSGALVLVSMNLWARIETIIGQQPWTVDVAISVASSCVVILLFVVAITMPTELDFDFVHRYGYNYGSPSHAMSPESYASYFSWLFFGWFNPMIKIGSSKTINDPDLPEVVPGLRARTVWSLFHNMWPKSTLFRRIVWFHFASFLWQVTFVVFSTILDFAVPYFLRLFLEQIDNPTQPIKIRYLYIFFIFLAQVGRSLLQSQMFYMGRKINVSMIALLNGEIYAKTLTRRDMSGLVDKKEDTAKKGDGKKDGEKPNAPASSGKVVNLMSTDTVRVAGVINFWHIGISSPIGIVLGTYLLYDLLGWSCLVGMMVLVLTIPANKWVRDRYAKGQRELSAARDERVTLMGELIQGIRMIKFFAWEMSFSEKILKAREFELSKLVNVYKNTILFQLVWFSSPLMVTLLSFYCYIKIQKGEFTSSVAFTAMVLFNRLKGPLNGLPAVYMALTSASVSLARINDYLSEPNMKDVFAESHSSRDPNAPEIGLVKMNAQWWNSESAKTPDAAASATPVADRVEDADQFALRDISINFPVGQLSIICGPTGGGKSSLLLGLLGEMDVLSGKVYLPRLPLDAVKEHDPETGLIMDGVAYVSQQAWLQNATIRDNILFGSKYEQERYEQVLSVCALTRDLEIFEDGDQTEIGEKGITLSGGQKQRVSLARAIYSRARHVLLDDCISALDAHTAEHIHAKCLTGPIMANRTCILVTHHVRLCIPTAKYLVLIENGTVALQGEVSKLREQGLLSRVMEQEQVRVEAAAPEEVSDSDTIPGDEAGASSNTLARPAAPRRKSTMDKKKTVKEAKKLIQEETREEGQVKFSIYKVYAMAAGGVFYWLVILAGFVLTRYVEVWESLWIRVWTNSVDQDSDVTKMMDFLTTPVFSGLGSLNLRSQSPVFADNSGFQSVGSFQSLPSSSLVGNDSFVALNAGLGPKHSINYYLGIYALISAAACLCHVLQTIIIFYGSLAAARTLYRRLLLAVVRAPLRFFDITPVGRIMNRFSKDFETVDGSIASNCAQFLSLILSVSSIILVLSYITPIFIIVAIVISFAYLSVGKKYINTSRELKRLHSVTRSPIFSSFAESLQGVATIRAFGAQNRFMMDLLKKVDASNRPFYYLWVANRWLSVRSDSIGAVVALSSGVFILMNPIGIDAGTAGLALTYALEFVALVNYLVREYTEIEMELNAIERISEYTDMVQEPPAIIEQNRPSAAWPTDGSIEFNSLELKYAPDLDTVIKGISFKIGAREKIGVVGRTGSGKSTLALSLFRFVEPTNGSISIDGIDITKVGLDDLRSRLTIIPQDPMLFKGTIRSNLDPFDNHSDAELWESLRRVHLVGNDVGSSTVASAAASIAEGSGSGSGSGTATPVPKVNISFSSLENPVSESGSNLSQGQRQLLTLARALLRKSKIYILDESTASIDYETDQKIQNTIQEDFKDSTLITIAHRLRTVIEYDRILVLDHGTILEYDTPTNLLALDGHGGRSKSQFRQMCEASGELDVLTEMAAKSLAKRHLESL